MKLNVKNSTWIEQQFSVVNLFHYWEYSVEILKKKKWPIFEWWEIILLVYWIYFGYFFVKFREAKIN